MTSKFHPVRVILKNSDPKKLAAAFSAHGRKAPSKTELRAMLGSMPRPRLMLLARVAQGR